MAYRWLGLPFVERFPQRCFQDIKHQLESEMISVVPPWQAEPVAKHGIRATSFTAYWEVVPLEHALELLHLSEHVVGLEQLMLERYCALEDEGAAAAEQHRAFGAALLWHLRRARPDLSEEFLAYRFY